MAKANPLQEQLLKAGMVKESKVAEVAREQNKVRHGKDPSQPSEIQLEAERDRAEKMERDRAFAAQRKRLIISTMSSAPPDPEKLWPFGMHAEHACRTEISRDARAYWNRVATVLMQIKIAGKSRRFARDELQLCTVCANPMDLHPVHNQRRKHYRSLCISP